MNNHAIRANAMKLLYEREMGGDGGRDTLSGLLEVTEPADMEPVEQLYQGVADVLEEVDQAIAGNLRGWTLDRVSRVDLAILRIGCYELKYKKMPAGVVINEALLLAEEYSSDRSRAFINGVLGSIARSIQ